MNRRKNKRILTEFGARVGEVILILAAWAMATWIVWIVLTHEDARGTVWCKDGNVVLSQTECGAIMAEYLEVQK